MWKKFERVPFKLNSLHNILEFYKCLKEHRIGSDFGEAPLFLVSKSSFSRDEKTPLKLMKAIYW